MNIRSLISGITNTPLAITRSDTELKMQASADRDANGNQGQQHSEPEKRKLTEEELVKLTEVLKKMPGIKDNNLTFEFTEQNGQKILLIKNLDDEIVKRMTELEFLGLLNSSENSTGRLLNKAM